MNWQWRYPKTLRLFKCSQLSAFFFNDRSCHKMMLVWRKRRAANSVLSFSYYFHLGLFLSPIGASPPVLLLTFWLSAFRNPFLDIFACCRSRAGNLESCFNTCQNEIAPHRQVAVCVVVWCQLRNRQTASPIKCSFKEDNDTQHDSICHFVVIPNSVHICLLIFIACRCDHQVTPSVTVKQNEPVIEFIS